MQRDRSTNGCLEHLPFPENFHASTNPWVFNCYAAMVYTSQKLARKLEGGIKIRGLANDCPSDA